MFLIIAGFQKLSPMENYVWICYKKFEFCSLSLEDFDLNKESIKIYGVTMFPCGCNGKTKQFIGLRC